MLAKRDDFSFMAVDKIRSTPLFFTKIDEEFYVDSNPKNLVKIDGFKKDLRDDALLEISMAGFTIGNKTVYKHLHALKAGELVIFDNQSFKYIQYYKYFGEIEDKKYVTIQHQTKKTGIKIA